MAKVFAALLAAQREFPPIAKDATNPFHKSKYATLDAVLSAVLPVLHKHGLALTQSIATPDYNEAGQLTAFTITTTLIHAESGESISSTLPMPLAKSDPQGAGGAVTYARRYSLQLALGVCAEEDDDGNHASIPARKAAASPAKPSKPASASSGAPEDFPMPFGNHKGVRLGSLETPVLKDAIAWCAAKDETKFASLIDKMQLVLDNRGDAA